MEIIVYLIFDLVLWTTGSVVLWVVTFGNFKLARANRGSSIYYLLSVVGLIFWLVVLYISVTILGD